MMRMIALPLLLMAAAPTGAWAQAATPAAPPASSAHYSVKETDIGTLLDDPAAKAIIDKHLPGFSSNPQIGMARPMTLKAIQQYAPDLPDAALAAIQADFNTIPKK